MPRNPNKVPCTFPGCHNWAVHGKTRCYAHRYAAEPDLAYEDAMRTLRATLERGVPGQDALSDDDPLGLLPPVDDRTESDPLFPPAGDRVDPGQLSCPSDDTPLTDLDAHIVRLDESLRGLAAHVRRLDAQLERDPALLPAYTRLLNLQGQLTSRLARLLRERQQIRQVDDQDLFHDTMNAALDQLGETFGIQL
jgi:hypothetical protein